MTPCILEANLATSVISYPFQRGWTDTPEWLILRDRVTPEMLQEEASFALIDAVEATSLFDTHSVISDVALVSTHQSAVRMRTTSRPDEVEHAVVQLGGVSATAEALARSTIYHFYGIDVVDWNRSQQPGDVTLIEGEECFRESEDGYLEDLARAWFILTSLPVPTHVFVAPRTTVEGDPKSVERVVEVLKHAVSIAGERRRELRRNLSDDYDIHRELFTEFLNDQKPWLTRSGRKGWLDLANRVARSMHLPDNLTPDVVTVSTSERE
jgi:predicted solute-binding protein